MSSKARRAQGALWVTASLLLSVIAGLIIFSYGRSMMVKGAQDTLRYAGSWISAEIGNSGAVISPQDLTDRYSAMLKVGVEIYDERGAFLAANKRIQLEPGAIPEEVRLTKNSGQPTAGYAAREGGGTAYYAFALHNAYIIRLNQFVPIDLSVEHILFCSLPFWIWVISMCVAAVVRRSVSFSLDIMSQYVGEIAQENFDAQLRLPTGTNDLGRLTRALQFMAHRLHGRINDLNRERDNLQSVLTTMFSGIMAIDAQKRIMLANHVARSMSGFEKDPVGRYFQDAPNFSPAVSLVEDVLTQKLSATREFVLGKFVVIMAVSPILSERHEEPQGVAIMMQDVTELRRLERMRTEFVANVTHELRTPLTSIKGFIETLRQGAIDDPDAAQRFLYIIDVEAERLARLIDDLLSLSEIESGRINLKAELVSVDAIALQTVEMLETQASAKDISLSLNRDDAQHYCMGSPDHVKQLLVNLVDNAIKYTQKGGQVGVFIRLIDGRIHILVRDTGIGIPQQSIPRLFERFYRVDKGRSRAMGGTGLGLAIVKHIVSMMGGDIHVESIEGKGSAFTIDLPAVDPQSEEPPPEKQDAQSEDHGAA